MRPQGIIRRALLESARRLANERSGASWREIASAAEVAVIDGESVAGERVQRGVAPGIARNTVKNMVRVGELVEVGRDKPAGSLHWHALYAPAEAQHDAPTSGVALQSLNELVSGWARCSV